MGEKKIPGVLTHGYGVPEASAAGVDYPAHT
jgi:hypothetical protein